MFDDWLCEESDVDRQLNASVKKILLEHIVFKEALHPDEERKTSKKYKPINAGFCAKMKSHSILKQKDVLPKPNVILFPMEKIENKWKTMQRIGPGLANLGNTCFLNSVLQVLAYTPPLVNYILSDHHKKNGRCFGFCMQCELTNHFNRVSKGNSNMAIRPMSIIEKLTYIGKNFRFGRQEDAHEFLRYVVEAIQKSDYVGRPNLDKLSKETTVANAIFGGTYRSQVKCLKCHMDSNTYEPMMDLNLDVKDCSTIMQALQRSISPDRLEGENKYYCARCRSKTIAQKKGNILKEPNVLTLQLKRFDFTNMFGGKISKHVSFPDQLDIQPFMCVQQGSPVYYKLYSVLVHSGYSCNSGHYYCYVKASNGIWYEMNDTRVSQVGLHTVLNAQAYILFYLRTDKKQTCEPTNPPIKSVSSPNPPIKSVSSPVLSSLNVQKSATNFKSSFVGVPIQRGPAPKITWNRAVTDKLHSPKEKAKLQLSSLEAITVSYGSNDSATPSPAVSPVGKKTESEISRGLETDTRTVLVKTNSNSQNIAKSIPVLSEHDANKETKRDKLALNLNANVVSKAKQSPLYRSKLFNGKYFTNKKFNIWSPLTKAALHHRVVNKSLSEGELERQKYTPLEDGAGQLEDVKRRRTSSETSSTENIRPKSTHSVRIHPQSAPSTPIIQQQRNHTELHITPSENKKISELDLTKKKKYREKKHEEEEWVEVGCKRKHQNDDGDVTPAKKKKKKRKHEKDVVTMAMVQHEYSQSADERKHKKKKRKKHKKKHSRDSPSKDLTHKSCEHRKSKTIKKSKYDHTSSDSSVDLPRKSSRKSTPDQEVPCHVWDEERKSGKGLWDGSSKPSLDYLEHTHSKVSSWDGADNSSLYNKTTCDSERAMIDADDWDIDCDKKKRKKSGKQRGLEETFTRNAFQELQDYRNVTKDPVASHRLPKQIFKSKSNSQLSERVKKFL